jgi:hypothetical protein
MAALTADIKAIRYGTPGNSTQPVQQPVKANSTVYRGSVAITRSGFVVAASTPQSGDLVWGVIESAGAGQPDLSPGVVGGSTDGAVTVLIATGSFFLASGTGSDALTQANVGATVFLIDEKTVGATNGGATRPQAGVMEAFDNTIGGGGTPIAVKLGSNQSTGAPS